MSPEPPLERPQWAADIEIDATLATRLLTAQFPQLNVARVEPLGIGWDNAAFLIDGHIVFRFPRRQIAAALIEREVRLLPSIASRLPLPISAPQYVGAASLDYPWAFAGYEFIAGETACSVRWSPKERVALAPPLARFLSALHDIDPTPLVAAGLPPDEIGRLDHHKRLGLTRERLQALAAAGLLADPQPFVAWLEAHPPVALAGAKRRLVHGDLYARHVLVDAHRCPAGIIDWGDVHLGDPALDVAIAHLLLPPAAHAAFRAAYGALDDRTWAAARYRAIYHAVLELDYGARANDRGMRAIGADALALILPALDEQ